MSSLFDTDDVVPLISHDGTAYREHPETVAFLNTIDTPVAFVSIAGRFRTGKSLLINTLCDADGAFQVGETIQACTKGIRIRKTPLHASAKLTVFVLDTEGIGSLDADSQHDCNILALSLLLSSSFIYNSVGSIDHAALESLGLMTRVSEFIRVDPDHTASEGELASFFPRFYWVLRDFSLRLESAKGERCSESEYLESALADAEGHEDRNRIRASLRNSFPHRSLVTLPRPAQDVQRLSRRTMSSAFLASVKKLRSRIIDEIQPLRTGDREKDGHPVTGAMFAEICKYFIHTLNKPGAVPCIRDSWSMMAEVQAAGAMVTVSKEANEAMRTLAASPNANPTQLRNALEALIERSIDDFGKRLMQPDVTRGDELRTDLRKEAERHVAECQAIFDKKIEESMYLLETAANRDDAQLGEIASLVSQALRQLEVDLGDDPHGLARWRAKCLENLVHLWIPRLLHTYENERELNTLASAELKSRYEEAERSLDEVRTAMNRETERLRRDAELQVEASTVALHMQLDAKEADLRDERSRTADLEQLLSAVRLELATLRARAESENGDAGTHDEDAVNTTERSTSASDEDDDNVCNETANNLPLRGRRRIVELETEVRSLGDEVRELRTIRDTLSVQCEKEKDERQKIEFMFQQRLQTLQSKQTDVIERLRREYDEAVRKARDEANTALQKETEWRRDLVAAQQQSVRAEAVRDEGEQLRRREIRACQEAQLALRAMCEDLQLRMVDMQKASLADVREREQTHRDKLAEITSEHLQVQMQRGEAQRREERALDEVKQLKRKLSNTDEANREAKRQREAAEEHRARCEQFVSENDRLRVRLEEAINERERLRTAHIQAESERAAVKRELELVRAERGVTRE